MDNVRIECLELMGQLPDRGHVQAASAAHCLNPKTGGASTVRELQVGILPIEKNAQEHVMAVRLKSL